MVVPTNHYTGGVGPLSQFTPLFDWLLAPLRAPEVRRVLGGTDFLACAQKLDLQAFLQMHLVAQLQRYDSWHHTVAMMGAVPFAQETILPLCPPPSPDQEELKRRRQQIARLKRYPPQERWGKTVTALAQFRQQTPPPTDLSPPRPISVSQLSRANRRVPVSFWKDLIDAVLAVVTPEMGNPQMPGVGPVRAVDASLFRVPSTFPWARYQKEIQAVKIVVEYDVVTTLVQAPWLTEGYVHDDRAARHLPKQPGTTYIRDRGFWHFAELDRECRQGIYFVTRCKANTVAARLRSNPVSPGSNVLADEEVVIGKGAKRMEHSVRLITVVTEDGSLLRLVTNRFDLPAEVIAHLYRCRWHIELFFRWLKHHFRTRRFFGRSREAVYAQIAAAFVVHILLVYRQRQLGYRGSLLDFARHVSAGPFSPVPTAWAQIAA